MNSEHSILDSGWSKVEVNSKSGKSENEKPIKNNGYWIVDTRSKIVSGR